MANKSIPIISQNKQGNVHINQEHQQIRAQVNPEEPGAWYHPLSFYRAGKVILRGQPVSIAFEDELPVDAKISGEPCVVPTDPHKHNWCIGIALEPGTPDSNPDPLVDNSNYVHILSSGKLKFDKNETRVGCFEPPTYTDNLGRKQFVWTYNDIGKSVYVSNTSGHEGELTIDVTEAYANGANIICVGHLADAPTAIDASHPDPNGSQIIIEVQLDGDNRGLIDSTEFSLELLSAAESGLTPGPQNTGSNDRLICVKVVQNSNGDYRGKMILSNEDLLENGGQQSPVGAFLAEPGVDYSGVSVVVYRLGIVEGHTGHEFNYSSTDFGKDIYLSKGYLITTGSDTSYEYKVGVVINSNRVLVDCRYARIFRNFEMIGKIKPLYDGTNTDPGYMIVDPNDVHEVRDYYDPSTNTGLLTVILYQDIADFFDASNNPIDIRSINGWQTMTALDFYNNWPGATFKFKEMMYEFNASIGGSVARTQIKYSTEGAPDNLQYVWPSKVYQIRLTSSASGPSNPTTPAIKLDITDLVQAGETLGGGSSIVDDYIATLILQTEQANPNIDLHNVSLSSGYYTVPIRNTVSYQDTTQRDSAGNPLIVTETRTDPYLAGFEWTIQSEVVSMVIGNPPVMTQVTKWYMCAVTDPGNLEPPNPDPTWWPPQDSPITSDHILGICYPPGKKIINPIRCVVLVRRRPTFYHDLLLNQLYSDASWRGSLLFDGDNLGVNSAIYFEHVTPGAPSPTGGQLSYIDTTYSNSISIKDKAADPSDQSFYDTNKRYKIFEILYGPQVTYRPDGTVDITNPIDQAVVRHQAMYPDSTQLGPYGPIDMRYNFPETSIETNASFAAKFSFPTMQSNPTLGVTVPYSVYIRELYKNDGTNKYPATTTPRKAMKTLHEIPTFIFSYLDKMTHNIIGSPQTGFFPIALGTDETGTDPSFQRDIFPPGPSTIDTLSYTYESDTTKTSLADMVEWELLQQELDMIFNPNGLGVGGDYWRNYQLLQSNVGLLNRGAKETQDRLLRIERSMFGGDAPEVPKHIINDQDFYINLNAGGLDYTNAQTNAGVLRLVGFMFKNNIVFEGPAPGDVSGLNTYYPDMQYDMYGNWDSKDFKTGALYSWLTRNTQQIVTPRNKIENSKMAIAYLFAGYHHLDNHDEGIPNTYFSTDYKPYGYHSSANIYMKKSWGSYSSFFPGFNTIPPWPLIKEAVDIGISVGTPYGYKQPTDAFFGPTNGLSDGIPNSKTIISTFASQSVEGYIYDILLKLSFVRNCFDQDTRSLLPEISILTSKQMTLIDSPVFVSFSMNGFAYRVDSQKNYPSGLVRAKRPQFYADKNYDKPGLNTDIVFSAIQVDTLSDGKIIRFGRSVPKIIRDDVGELSQTQINNIALTSAECVATFTYDYWQWLGTPPQTDPNNWQKITSTIANATAYFTGTAGITWVAGGPELLLTGSLLISSQEEVDIVSNIAFDLPRSVVEIPLKSFPLNITIPAGTVINIDPSTRQTLSDIVISSGTVDISYPEPATVPDPQQALIKQLNFVPQTSRTLAQKTFNVSGLSFTQIINPSQGTYNFDAANSDTGDPLIPFLPYKIGHSNPDPDPAFDDVITALTFDLPLAFQGEVLGIEVKALEQGIRLYRKAPNGDINYGSVAKLRMGNVAYFSEDNYFKENNSIVFEDITWDNGANYYKVLLKKDGETITKDMELGVLDPFIPIGTPTTIGFIFNQVNQGGLEFYLFCNGVQVAGGPINQGSVPPSYTITPSGGSTYYMTGIVKYGGNTLVTQTRMFLASDSISGLFPRTCVFNSIITNENKASTCVAVGAQITSITSLLYPVLPPPAPPPAPFYNISWLNISPIVPINNIITIEMLASNTSDTDLYDVLEVLFDNGQKETLIILQKGTKNLNQNFYAPIILPNQDIFQNSLEISILELNQNAIIRYTTDGTIPTQNSQIYANPFNIQSLAGDETFTIRARSYRGTLMSDVSFRTYYAEIPTP